MTTPTHAFIIGGSIAGMLAANTLAPYFDQVTIIERDRFADTDAVRNGTPQGQHLHVLLGRGLQILEAMLPGLGDDLDALGAVKIDVGMDAASHLPNGWVPSIPTGVYSYGVSRAGLERTIRARVLALNSNIVLEEGVEVIALHEQDSAIVSVTLQQRRTAEQRVVTVNFVVDASGRNSKAPAWLAALGYAEPQETVVETSLGYATRWYPRPQNMTTLKGMVTRPDRRMSKPRGGGFVEVEGDRWAVVLSGMKDDVPPKDDAGFLDYLRSLPTPLLYDALHDAEPLTPVYTYRYTGSRWRHYEGLRRQPDGFIVLGDAVCSFNPVYGQGMTVAAMGVEQLARLLRKRSPMSRGFTAQFQQRLARALRVPWQLATGEDARANRSANERSGFFSHYFAQIVALMPTDEVLTDAFIRVANLVSPPTVFFHPRIVWRVLRSRWISHDDELAARNKWQAPDGQLSSMGR